MFGKSPTSWIDHAIQGSSPRRLAPLAIHDYNHVPSRPLASPPCPHVPSSLSHGCPPSCCLPAAIPDSSSSNSRATALESAVTAPIKIETTSLTAKTRTAPAPKNAPTKMMASIGYGKGYVYNPSNAYERGCPQGYLPPELGVGRTFFDRADVEPGQHLRFCDL